MKNLLVVITSGLITSVVFSIIIFVLFFLICEIKGINFIMSIAIKGSLRGAIAGGQLVALGILEISVFNKIRHSIAKKNRNDK